MTRIQRDCKFLCGICVNTVAKSQMPVCCDIFKLQVHVTMQQNSVTENFNRFEEHGTVKNA